MGGTGVAVERPRAEVNEPLPLGQRARFAIGILVLAILVDVLAVAADIHQYDLLQRIQDGARVPFDEASASDDNVSRTGILQLVALAIGAVAFLLWYSRAYRNVIAMGIRRPRYGTRWAVGYWFIPIVNLFRPKQVMNDIYRGSDPRMALGDTMYATRPVAALVHWWWGIWIASALLSRLAANGSSTTAEELQQQTSVYIISDVLEAVGAILVILVIHRITERAEERRSLYASGQLDPDPPPPPPPPPAAPPPPEPVS